VLLAKKEIGSDLLLMTVGKSLMYKRKSRGSSIEPWGFDPTQTRRSMEVRHFIFY